MIDIEISPSNRAKCNRCGDFIKKDTPRGFIISYENKYPNYIYYCYKCAKIEITETINFLKEKLKELNEEIKKHQKDIIIGEL